MSEREPGDIRAVLVHYGFDDADLPTYGDGERYVVFSTEIGVLVDEFPLMLELTNAKPVMLKAMPSA